jgi:CheY-like chemotaxis protein
MNKAGPIIIIEDDEDDRDLLTSAFKSLKIDNPIMFFEDGHDAFEYLLDVKVKPFLVISDINMPKLGGFELRDRIHSNDELRIRCIPYIFMTTASSPTFIIQAYSKSVQGFFIKPNSFPALQSIIKKIVEYWNECAYPNKISLAS